MFVGIVVGAIPGLNGPMAIAIAIPLTFVLSPLAAISFLVGINKGANFGGAISAVLMNVPGAAEAIATTFDGYPLARKGKPLKALKMALYASVVGDTFSDLVLILVAAPFAILALTMGPAELTALMLFALTFIAAVVGKSMMKGLIAGALGIFASTIGLDPEASTPRMTFDVLELEEGIPLLAMVIGMLALSEIMIQIEDRRITRAAGATRKSRRSTRHPARGPHRHRAGIPRQLQDHDALGRDRHRDRRDSRSRLDAGGLPGLRRGQAGIEEPGGIRQGRAGWRRRRGIGQQRDGGRQSDPNARARHPGQSVGGDPDQRADHPRADPRAADLRAARRGALRPVRRHAGGEFLQPVHRSGGSALCSPGCSACPTSIFIR